MLNKPQGIQGITCYKLLNYSSMEERYIFFMTMQTRSETTYFLPLFHT